MLYLYHSRYLRFAFPFNYTFINKKLKYSSEQIFLYYCISLLFSTNSSTIYQNTCYQKNAINFFFVLNILYYFYAYDNLTLQWNIIIIVSCLYHSNSIILSGLHAIYLSNYKLFSSQTPCMKYHVILYSMYIVYNSNITYNVDSN